ncbi:hypothetical protein MRY87_09945 [bacterium]|nr:hypothetical protein [bacterium]
MDTQFISNTVLARGISAPLSAGRGHGAFQEALAFTLYSEGGVSRDELDPGNAGGTVTVEGVTQTTYNHWRAEQGLPERSVLLSTQAERSGLYHEKYYTPLQGDRLPREIAIAVFDAAVNLGPQRSAILLQRTLQHHGAELALDGIIGEETISATWETREAKGEGPLLSDLLTARKVFYRELAQRPPYERYRQGWINRVNALHQFLTR